MNSSTDHDWLLLVPAELNDAEVLGLLLRNSAGSPVQTRTLTDGSVLLAGHFANCGMFANTEMAPQKMQARKASAFEL